MNGKTNCAVKSRKLDFALAMISAIRHKHNIHDPLTYKEIAELTREIVVPVSGCTWQNIYRIAQRALRKARRKKLARELKEQFTERKAA